MPELVHNELNNFMQASNLQRKMPKVFAAQRKELKIC